MGMLDTQSHRLDWQEDGSVIFTLRAPLVAGGRDLDTITITRPLLEHLLANEKSDGDDMIKTGAMICKLAGLKLPEIDEMDGGDTMVLAEVIARMLAFGERGSLLDEHDDRLTFTDHDASLRLMKPITGRHGVEEDTIVVRRPTFKEVRTNQGKTLAASIKFLAILTSMGPAILGKLDALDGKILAEVVNDFLGKPRQSSSGAQ